MPLPSIPQLDVNGASNNDVYAIEAILNQTSDQSIQDIAMNGSQEMIFTTQDLTNIQVPVPAARAGILSGMAFTWTGSLAADIAAGNYQGEGTSNSFAGVSPIGFAARHATFPRIDLVRAILSSPPTVQITLGTASATPQPPALPAGSAPLYYVWIDPTAAASPRDFVVASAQIDPSIPPSLGMELDGLAIKTNLPLKVKSLVFDPLLPYLNADVIKVDCSGGTVTVELPLPADYHEWKWTFVDFTGNATANTITLDADTVGGTTINGATTVTITADYGSLTVHCLDGEYYAS